MYNLFSATHCHLQCNNTSRGCICHLLPSAKLKKKYQSSWLTSDNEIWSFSQDGDACACKWSNWGALFEGIKANCHTEAGATECTEIQYKYYRLWCHHNVLTVHTGPVWQAAPAVRPSWWCQAPGWPAHSVLLSVLPAGLHPSRPQAQQVPEVGEQGWEGR